MATEIRNMARDCHDYGIYYIVGAVFLGIAGAVKMAWKFQKEKESIAPSPPARRTPVK